MDCYGDGRAAAIELDGERYLITPEQGFLDEEGRLFLLNRSDTPGNNIHLYRLEDAPDEITCALTVNNDCQTEARVVGAAYQLAKREEVTFKNFRVIRTIPYSPSGKVRIRDLKLLLSAA